MSAPATRPAPRARWPLLLLLIPFVALLFPGWYSVASPRFFGIPFFIWYQFLWVILAVLITGGVYLIEHGRERRP